MNNANTGLFGYVTTDAVTYYTTKWSYVEKGQKYDSSDSQSNGKGMCEKGFTWLELDLEGFDKGLPLPRYGQLVAFTGFLRNNTNQTASCTMFCEDPGKNVDGAGLTKWTMKGQSVGDYTVPS